MKASVVFIDNAFYVFSGLGGDKKIGRLDGTTKIWSMVGETVNRRIAGNAIYDGSSFLLIGGNNGTDYDSLATEKCSLSNGQIICNELQTNLPDYSHYPELFLIDVEFCKEMP